MAFGTYEVYRSETGATARNDNIRKETDELRNASDIVTKSYLGDSIHEKALRHLGSECSRVAGNLVTLLENLKAKKSQKHRIRELGRSIRASIPGLNKSGEIEAIQVELRELRISIILRLNLIIR